LALPPPYFPPNLSSNISEFKAWATVHGIHLVSVNKTTDDFYYNGATPSDFLPPDEVPRILEIANGLYKIPDNLLRVMRGKTFYLSHLYGRGYAVLGSWPDQHILIGMDRGVILEQPLTEEDGIHEFAHILDYHGIRGMYEDPENHWKHLDEQRAALFAVPFEYNASLVDPPPGYLDVYSTANDAENFAQHFTFYILHAEEFRARSHNDSLLRAKYDFFKDQLFDGREYGLPRP
jgi:hypothetical protein